MSQRLCPPYDAVVLAGGDARRLGGADKPAVTVGGRTLLDRALGSCADAARTVVVGPRRPTARAVDFTSESPSGAEGLGPLAALDAGLRRTTAPLLLVLSADLPFVTRATVRALLAAAGEAGAEGALVHAGGRDQPLLAVYRSDPLRRELALLRTEYGALSGLPLRLLVPELALRRVPDEGPRPGAAFDCDTWEDVVRARTAIREHGTVLTEWMTAAKAELGVELDTEGPENAADSAPPGLTTVLLDLARDAAHGVARPAAPLTSFLVGYAAANAGGTEEDVREAVRKATALAQRWAAEEDGTERRAEER